MLVVEPLWGEIFMADNVIIGANSVVTRGIESKGVVVAGCPAKIIRTLTKEELKMRSSYN